MLKKGDICVRAGDFAVYKVTCVYSSNLRSVGITAALQSTFPVFSRVSQDFVEERFFVELPVLEEGPVIELTTYMGFPQITPDILGAPV